MTLPPVLLLHGFRPLAPDGPFLQRLGRRCAVTAPAHPGFGGAPRPAAIETVYDLVHHYLALLDDWPDGTVSLVGFSFGGWLAAEVAAVASHRLRRLVLIDAVGIKTGDRETAEILDIFNDARAAPEVAGLSDEEVVALARDREALCRYGWHPYLHNPRLHHWLHRIAVPTLLLWGEEDRIVTPAYGEAFAARIPGARLERIAGAGHHPELEQPERCAEAIADFVGAP